MASYGHGLTAQGDLVRSTIADAKALTVDRLKKVLRAENLQVSGIKSELQTRLIRHIEGCSHNGEHEKVNRIRSLIRGSNGNYLNQNHNPYPSPYSATTPTASLSPQFTSPTPRPPPPLPSYPMPSFSQNRLTFKNSPFYTIIRSLTNVQELKAREQTRDTARLNVMLDVQTVEQLQRDPNTRVMVFCAAETFESRNLPCDISFPQHGELKCNSDDPKANLKGLKNKPGTTRPADITNLVRKKVNFPNSVELIYALTTKELRAPQKYYLVANLVQKKPVEHLLSDLRRGKYLSRDRVIQEMKTKASDPDIVATSSVMSLKDPVQMTRIQTPCRSTACRHNECFDAAAYLYLQEQAPTWTCPCCNRSAPWDSLVFDQYFDYILRNVSDDVEQVTVEPDGQWRVEATQDSGKSRNNDRDGDSDDDDDDADDDDLVMIADPRGNNMKDFTRTPSFTRTPDIPGPSTSAPHSAHKRKHAETIDLTIDDSDDDDLPRTRSPPKRSNTGSSTVSFSFNSLSPNTSMNPNPHPVSNPNSNQNSFQSPQMTAPYRIMPPPPFSPNGYPPSGYYTG